jgi:hypothetical protein
MRQAHKVLAGAAAAIIGFGIGIVIMTIIQAILGW